MTAPQASDASIPNKVCDIVMKGGITSGVVYPLALSSLAQEYRFSNIGGTSAGAIAAAAAAAAEYGRLTKSGGFTRLARIPEEIGPDLLALFQPTPSLKPLFDMFVAALAAKSKLGRVWAIIRVAVTRFFVAAIIGLLPGAAVIAIAARLADYGLAAFGVLLALVGLVIAILLRLWRAAMTDLPNNDFGLCPGLHQPHASPEAFTDWLARLIDEAAGRSPQTDPPLTFGDLAAPPEGRPAINLAMMTTSLMEKRPYVLPMEGHRFVFEKNEWAKLFPERIMAFLTKECAPYTPLAGETGEFYHFPDASRLPLVVAARLSLSFPILIMAVPLWCRDFTLAEEAERNKLRRCLFSDGGLSSNFPIHFFDRLMPNSPTFAISLDEFDPKRNRNNVWLPSTAGGGSELPIVPFAGMAGFLSRLIDSAKDWQDNLQSTLPGYRERIAHVVLKSDEGGLNVTMDEKTVAKLSDYGQQAARLLRDEFNLDEHRWRRFLVAMARMEETLDDVGDAYFDGKGLEPFANFLDRYAMDPAQYKQRKPGVLAAMLARGKALADKGVAWRTKPTIRDGDIPKPGTHLRIMAKQ